MNCRFLPEGPIRKGRFIERPNRFIVKCHIPRVGVVAAHLANPGRLSELLLPDATLHLSSASTPGRKTDYSVLAVERDGAPVFLDTHRTNRVARALIEQQRIPELRGFELVRAEVPLGKSRFDFLLRKNHRDLYLEVKSCTLFGNGVAMFPDAITERGRKHLIELASLDGRRQLGAVLFLIQSPAARWFMPDYHTDLAFSRTFLNVRKRLMILPIAIRWKGDLSLSSTVKSVEIPWDYLEREVDDRGSYLLILKLKRAARIRVGQLGTFTFNRGHYIYVGSAMRNLTARVARHQRLRKRLHWHVDYLRQKSEVVAALPIRSSRRDECAVAGALLGRYRLGSHGFGSSDCGCAAHLFHLENNPLNEPAFHRVLQDFRMNVW